MLAAIARALKCGGYPIVWDDDDSPETIEECTLAGATAVVMNDQVLIQLPGGVVLSVEVRGSLAHGCALVIPALQSLGCALCDTSAKALVTLCTRNA